MDEAIMFGVIAFMCQFFFFKTTLDISYIIFSSVLLNSTWKHAQVRNCVSAIMMNVFYFSGVHNRRPYSEARKGKKLLIRLCICLTINFLQCSQYLYQHCSTLALKEMGPRQTATFVVMTHCALLNNVTNRKRVRRNRSAIDARTSGL